MKLLMGIIFLLLKECIFLYVFLQIYIFIYLYLFIVFLQVEDEMIQCVICEDWYYGRVSYNKI